MKKATTARGLIQITVFSFILSVPAFSHAEASEDIKACKVEVTKKNGATPFMVAAATSQFAQAEALMQNGADPNNCDQNGATCLDLSWDNRRMEQFLTGTAARLGAGASGAGRQRAYTRIHTDPCGEQPAL